MKKLFQINNEILFQPFKEGIRLISPHDNVEVPAFSLSDTSKTELSFYLTAVDHTIYWCNETCLSWSGFASLKEALGKSVCDLPYMINETAQKIIQNNHYVLMHHQNLIVEEDVIFENDECKNYLTFKMPCYDEKTHLIGVFGCSFIIEPHSLVHSLNTIARLGFLKLNPILKKINLQNNIYLSKREIEVLYHFIKGKSAKAIASLLQLSARTIENYLKNIKFKFNVNSKQKLIESGFQYFGIYF